MKEILEGINKVYFYPKYTNISNWSHKVRGKDGNGKQLAFTKDEIKSIIIGLKAMNNDTIQLLENLGDSAFA